MDRQDLEGIGCDLSWKELLGILGQLNPAQGSFNDNFPPAYRTEPNLIGVVGKDLSSPLGETVAISDPPEKRRGIEEDPHSKLRKSSSGKGASKVGSTVTWPRALPGDLRPFGDPKGTRRATGLPPLAIVISSPWSTRSMSFDKCVFAS